MRCAHDRVPFARSRVVLVWFAFTIAAACRERRTTIAPDDATAAPKTAVELCLDIERARLLHEDRCSNRLQWSGPLERALLASRRTCEMLVVAPGTVFDRAHSEACVAALATAACFGPLPQACEPNGTLREGGACAFDDQCARGFYCHTETQPCGTCRRKVRLDEPCSVSVQCERGLQCVLGMGCRRAKLLGEECWRGECAAGLHCPVSRGKPSTCRQRAGEGQPCHPKSWSSAGVMQPEEPCAYEYQCVDGQCVRWRISPLGGACNDWRECRDDMHCTDGRCLPKGDVGAPCGELHLPHCLDELRCIEGHCARDDARRCR